MSRKQSANNKAKGPKGKPFDFSLVKRELAQLRKAVNAKRTTSGGRRPPKKGSSANSRPARSALDPRLVHFAATVTNPFKADALQSIAKGIFDSSGLSRSVARVRRVIVPINIPGSDTAPNGVDIFIPLTSRAPPFVQYAYNWDLSSPQSFGPSTGYAGNDTSVEYGEGSSVRLVAAGVKIGYDGASQNRGGRFYHFPTFDLQASSVDKASVANTFGSTYSNLKKAISTVEVPNRGDITFILPPRSGFEPVDATVVPVAPASVAGGGFAPTDGIRLYYNGTGGPYTLEICAVVEYYDSGDSSACTPTTNHIAGQAIVQNFQNHLTAPLSDNSHVESSGGTSGKFKQLASLVREASGALGEVKHFASSAYDFGKGMYGVYNSFAKPAGATMALLAA